MCLSYFWWVPWAVWTNRLVILLKTVNIDWIWGPNSNRTVVYGFHFVQSSQSISGNVLRRNVSCATSSRSFLDAFCAINTFHAWNSGFHLQKFKKNRFSIFVDATTCTMGKYISWPILTSQTDFLTIVMQFFTLRRPLKHCCTALALKASQKCGFLTFARISGTNMTTTHVWRVCAQFRLITERFNSAGPARSALILLQIQWASKIDFSQKNLKNRFLFSVSFIDLYMEKHVCTPNFSFRAHFSKFVMQFLIFSRSYSYKPLFEHSF